VVFELLGRSMVAGGLLLMGFARAYRPMAAFFRACTTGGGRLCTALPRLLPKLPKACVAAVGQGVVALAAGAATSATGIVETAADIGGECAKWRSKKSPLTTVVANEIEHVHPNRIDGVDVQLSRIDMNKLTDFDISGDDFVVEVFTGPGSGDKDEQIRRIVDLAADEGRRVAVFAPDAGPT